MWRYIILVIWKPKKILVCALHTFLVVMISVFTWHVIYKGLWLKQFAWIKQWGEKITTSNWKNKLRWKKGWRQEKLFLGLSNFRWVKHVLKVSDYTNRSTEIVYYTSKKQRQSINFMHALDTLNQYTIYYPHVLFKTSLYVHLSSFKSIG